MAEQARVWCDAEGACEVPGVDLAVEVVEVVEWADGSREPLTGLPLVAPGEQVVVHYRVRNRGDVAADSAILALCWMQEQDGCHQGWAEFVVGALAPGAVDSATVSLPAPVWRSIVPHHGFKGEKAFPGLAPGATLTDTARFWLEPAFMGGYEDIRWQQCLWNACLVSRWTCGFGDGPLTILPNLDLACDAQAIAPGDTVTGRTTSDLCDLDDVDDNAVFLFDALAQTTYTAALTSHERPDATLAIVDRDGTRADGSRFVEYGGPVRRSRCRKRDATTFSWRKPAHSPCHCKSTDALFPYTCPST